MMNNNYNSWYSSGITTCVQTWQKKAVLLLFFVMFGVFGVNAQVTTNGGSGLAGSYGTLAEAITALNAATISSPVVITLTGNETAPAGGYNITKSGTSTNTITIQGSSSTITAPTPQASGILVDAIFKITGADWITIQNFTMQENAANTTTTAASNNMTEFGVALFYATATDGAQNCTIQNNTISLNRTYQNTFGIYSNSTHTATNATTSATASSVAGSNSGLKVYGNAISNVNFGIMVVGPTAAANHNTGIDIGGAASGTGNTITNFGTTSTFSGYANVSGTVNGILVRNSTGFNVSYNSVTSSNGGITAAQTLRGIFIPAASNAPTGTFTNTINNNTIALTHGFSSGTIQGITVEATTGTATSTQNINNNNFTALGSSVTTSGTITAISCVMPNLVTNINSNTFTNITSNTTGSFTFIGHSYTMPAGGSQTISGNSIVTAFNKTGAGGTVTVATSSSSSPNGTTSTVTNNNFSNITVTGATGITGLSNFDGSSSSATRVCTGNTFNNWVGGTGSIIAITYGYFGGTTSTMSNNTITNITGQSSITGLSIGSSANLATTLNVANNVINNLSSTGTGGAVIGLSCSNASTTINLNSNTIHTLSTTSSSAVTGISIGGGATTNVYQNKVYNLLGTNASSTVNGILITSGVNINTFNNLIGDLRATAASGTDVIRGISITSSTSTSNQRVYYNTIYLNGTSSGTNFGSSGIFHTFSTTATTSALDLRNNIVVNASSANGTGFAVAFRRSSATNLNNYASTSNNNLFFGTSGAFSDGTVASFGAFQTLVSPRETASKYQNPTFASITGSDATFLKFVSGAVNLAGASGQVIAGYTTDFDGETRDASTPDIGADEWVNGTVVLPTITGFTTAFSPTAPIYLCSNGGSVVTITGTNLDTVSSVLFNGGAGVNLVGSITNATSTSLTVTSPAGVVDGIIRVINPAGSVDSSSSFTTADPPTVGVSSAATICLGANTVLTATGANTYAWSPSTGLSATTGASVTASPTTNTTYTVTGTSTAGCTATNTVAITVSPVASAVTVSKNPTVACLGGITTLTANGGTVSSTPSAYGFAGTTGTYTPITGTTVTAAIGDEFGAGNLPIGFSFNYNGTNQTVFAVHSNGFLILGNTTPAITGNFNFTNALATGALFIAPLWDDNNTTGGSVIYSTTGTAPNRVLTVQWTGMHVAGAGSATNPTIDMQALLYENGNIQFIYGAQSAALSSPTASIGISGASGNYISVTPLSPIGTSTISSSTENTSVNTANIPSGTILTFNAPTQPSVLWSPSTDLFTDAAATQSYSGENIKVVYSKSNVEQTYIATATLGSCPTSGSVTVTPNALPTIATSGDVAICNGGAGASLTATGGVSYVWSPATGLSAANVANPTATPSTTTTYTVTGTDANGCQNTATAVVTVNEPVAVTVQPANQTALENGPASFSVTATGTGLTYQWEYSSDSGANWNSLSGETAATYAIASASTSQNNYLYRVVVSGTAPCASVTSASASLLVGSVAIVSQPTSQTICSDGTATFAITTTGDVTSYLWQYSTDNVNWFTAPGIATNSSLVLTGINSSLSGYLFRCSLNGGALISNAATLTVFDAIVIGTQPASQTVCSNAASVSFESAATGSGVSYQWQLSTDSGSNWNNVSGATSATYTINTPGVGLNNNQYRVVVSGTSPCSAVTSSVATLTITDVTVAASAVSICIGSSVTLSATYTGTPGTTTSSWVSATAGSGAETPISGDSTSVTPTAAGTYVYTFTTNGDCSFTRTVSVTVNALPVISSVTATPATVCSDSPIALTGLSVVNANGTSALGAGATSSSSTGNSIFPGGWGGAKSQYLIRASELTALGYVAGNITSVAFEPTTSGQTYQGFFVSIASTSNTVLTTTFLSNGTQVYAGTLADNGFTPVANTVNTLAFGTGVGSASSFAWDGISNIVLTFSWSRVPSASTSTSSTMKSDTVGFVCGAYRQRDSFTPAAMLAETSASSTVSIRPRLTLGGVIATNLASTYTWSWNSTPAVTTATGTTSITNTSGSALNQTFTATATSAAGCTNSLTTSAVTVNTTIPAPTGTDSTQCGTATPTCSVVGSGTPGSTFRWYTVSTNGTAISGQTGNSLIAPYTIAATTIFYVSEVSADGLCESPRTAVTATVTPPLAFSLSASSTTNCSGSPSLIPITIATNEGYDSYSWSNSATVSGNETTGWTFSPTTTTTYTLTVTGGGCSTTATVVVTPTALPVVNVTAVPSSICVGASTTLTALTTTTASGTAKIGSGTTSEFSYSIFRHGYGNGNFRHQLLYSASELTAAGLTAGPLTSVAFNVTTLGSPDYSDYTVSLANVSATSLTTTFNPSTLTQVYTAPSFTLVSGINTFTFGTGSGSTGFVWDGISSVLVNVCYTVSGANTTSYVEATTTSSNTNSQLLGSTGACTATTATTAVTSRPNATFGGQVGSQGVGTLAYTWNDPATTTGNVLTVTPSATTTYTVSGYDSTTGCTATTSNTVTVFTPPTAPSVTNANQCGTRVPLVAVADTNGYTTPTFKWYADEVTTTALQTSTSTTYTTSVSTTTTFYVSVVSPGGCESPRAAVTTTVVAPATLIVSPAAFVCAGGSTVLSASGAVSYTWTPALGLSETTGASVTATPSATTTYSVTGVDENGCTTAAGTVLVTVNQPLPSITAGVNNPAVCVGATVNLTSTSTGSAFSYTEGFETFPPTGWTMLNPGLGNSWQATNVLEPDGVRTGASSMAYYYDADFSGNAWAITPAQTLTAGVPYTVSFWYRVPNSSYSENIKLTVGTLATVAGQTTTLINLTSLSDIGTFQQATATFTPTTTGTYYFGLNCFSIADQDTIYVDDFAISGFQPATYAWTSIPAGFTSSVQNPTNVTVDGETTYAVTASIGACTTSSSITVTPIALPTFTLSDDVTICKGQSTSLEVAGSGLTYLWSTGATTASISVTPSTTTTYTVVATETATGCQATQEVIVSVSDPGAILSTGTTTSQIVIPGGSTTFTVATASGPVYTYQWQVRTSINDPWTNLSDDSNYSNVDTATLTVANIDETFNGYQYQCLVTGESPCAALIPIVATLTVDTTGIEQQPQSVTVCAPSSTSFSIVTSGDEPYGIEWQISLDGIVYENISDGFDAVTGLTFSGVDQLTLNVSGITVANDGLKFLCQINFYLPSDAATLTVKSPVVASNPANQTVCSSGGTAVFSTTATGSDLAYQWQFSTDGGSSWNPYVGTDATTASISIINPALATDGTQYRVVVSGNAACDSVTTAAATLFINNPTITSQPASADVVRGNTATFSVVASAATSYQWQHATTLNGTYTNVADDTPVGITYADFDTATLTVVTSATTATGGGKFYRCVVTNNGCTVNSAGALLTVNWYCMPAPSSVDGIGITNVTMGDINNTTVAEAGNYGDYTSQSTSAAILSTVNFGITYSTGYSYGTKIWIDFNDDADFDDAGEQVYFGLSTNADPTTLSGSFSIPLTAPLGAHRMRIGGSDTDAGVSPCYTGTYASFEDYTINITAAPTCTGEPVAGTATATSNSLCLGDAGTTLTLTGSTSGVVGISYQWFSSANGVDFAPVSGETSVTLATGSLTADAYYYCTVTCSESSLSVNSNTVTVTVVNPLITGATPAGRCDTGTVVLGAETNAGSTINWYATATGGSVLGTGTSFTTPSIAATTTYYAEAVAGGGAGNATSTYSGTTNNGTSTGSHGIAITTTVPGIKIISADIPFTGTGTLTIALKDVSNSTVYSSVTTDTVTGLGTTSLTIPLNITVPTAGNYLLIVNSVSGTVGGLGYSTLTYPLTALADTFSVTGGYWYSITNSNMYLYNLAVSNGCSSARTAVVATVDPLPTATISYTDSPFCSTATIGTVTRTGTTGGTYSSTSGLTIDSSTGEIDITASTPGTYTVTYTMDGTTYCTAQTATTTVVINQALTSGFAYDFAAYCTNQGTATPTVSGASGTFTASPAGLSINSTTGAITLATSTAGTYTVTNTVSVAGCPNSVSTFELTINSAVVITAQPSSVSQLPGDNTSFSVTATGTGLTYQWEVNDGLGWTTLSGETAATLSLTAVTSEMNSYQYRVIVSGATSCAPVTSNAATLTVNTAAIATNPANFTACSEGANTASFSVTTTGVVTSYQWQVSTNGTTWSDITNGGIYADADTATLLLSGLSLSNDGLQFRCVLNGAVNSNPATLTIKTAVAITTQPSSATACSAGSTTFSVVATGDNLAYQWQESADGTTWNNISGATLATLTLNSLTVGMNGYQYQVIVSGASPCSPVTSSVATLVVNTVVAVSAQPANSTVCNGANATFSVTASGTALSYQWEISTDGTLWSELSGETASSLTVNAVTMGMSGYQYRVIISGAAPCGSVTSNVATLTVSQPVAPTFASASLDVCSDVAQALTVTNVPTSTLTLGTGTSLSTGSSTAAALGPNPMQTYYGGTRQQMLITAAELTTLGVSNGSVINSVAINLSAAESRTLQNFTVKMKNTSTTAFANTTFETGTTSVRNAANYSPVVGWNTIVFDNSFTYTGGSLIVELTFSNNDGGGSGTNRAYHSTTSYTSTLFYRADSTSATAVAAQTTASFSYSSRNNMQFGVLGAITTWSPATGLYTNLGATTAYTDGANATTVYVKTNTSQAYTATFTNSLGCTNSAVVNVNVLTSSTLASITQPAVTCSGSQTTFNLTGLLPNSTSTIGYTINGVVQTAITGVVADASGNASFTVALPAVNNGRTLAITSLTRTDLTPNCATAISANNTVVISVQPLVTYYADADGDGFGDNAVTEISCLGQPSGYVTNNTDCDDTNEFVNATFPFYADADGDGYGVGASVLLCAVNATTPPSGYSVNNTDCAPTDPFIYQTFTFYVDADGDTYGTGSLVSVCAVDANTPPAGYSLNNTDCNDANALLFTTYSFFADTDGDGFGAGSLVSVCAVDANTPPTGYSLSDKDCDPADPTKWQSTSLFVDLDGDGYDNGNVNVCWGATVPAGYSQTTLGFDCDDTDPLRNLTNPCETVVTVKMIIEGYYDTDTHAMKPVLLNQGVGSSETDVDTVTIELRDATTYELVDTTTAMLQTNGNAVATFATAPSGSFYIAVKHRNAIQTWSANPVTVGTSPSSYDFTTAVDKAYGDNMKMLELGVYGFYSGDLNLIQDENIDGFDYSIWESDYNDLLFGYYATDLNGDGNVDGFDYSIWETNYNNLIYSIHP